MFGSGGRPCGRSKVLHFGELLHSHCRQCCFTFSFTYQMVVPVVEACEFVFFLVVVARNVLNESCCYIGCSTLQESGVRRSRKFCMHEGPRRHLCLSDFLCHRLYRVPSSVHVHVVAALARNTVVFRVFVIRKC